MNEIATRTQYTANEIQSMDLVAENYKPFVKALLSDKVSALHKKEAVDFIFQTINKCLINSGITTLQGNDAALLSFSVQELICDHYKNVTTDEFLKAMKNGSVGIYGDFHGFNLKAVNHWIRSYLNDNDRILALKEWNEKLIKTASEPTDISKKIMFSEKACIDAFQKFKETKKVPFAAHAYYDIICDKIGVEVNGHKTVLTEKSDREMCFNQAKANLKNGYKVMGESIYNQVSEFLNVPKNIEYECKKVALKIYFEKLISQGKELEL